MRLRSPDWSRLLVGLAALWLAGLALLAWALAQVDVGPIHVSIGGVEHVRGLGRGDPRPFVGDLEPRAGRRRGRTHEHSAVRGRMTHRVLDEVRDDLVEALGVGFDREAGRLHVEDEPHAHVAQARLTHRVFEHRLDVEEPAVERDRARFEP